MRQRLSRLLRRVRRRLTAGPGPKQPADLGHSLRGRLDEPHDAWLPRWPVTFRGWALDGDELPVSVELVINAVTRIPAGLGDPRPDVARALPEARMAIHSGWSVTVDVSEWSGEVDITLQVVAESRSGQRGVLADRAFELRRHGIGRIERPAPDDVVDELLVVRGWAVTGSHGPARVDVEIDGQPAGRARLRVPQPDVEDEDPAHNGPFAGFEYRGAVPHGHGSVIEVDVVVVDRDGDEMRLPTRSVGVEKPTIAPADLVRAEALRQRTQEDAHRVVRVPSVPRRLSPGRDVLIFAHSLRLAGGELYLQELLRQLVPSMRRCILVSPSDGALRTELEGMGVEVLISGRALLPRDIETHEGTVRELTMLIRGLGCDLVIMNTLESWVAADAATRLGIPSIWAIHESFELPDWMDLRFGPTGCHPYIRERIEISLRAASHLVFEANATSEMFAPYAEPDQRMVIPYGVDVDAIDSYGTTIDREQARRERGLSEDATVLLAVGVLEERKSQACLVEAFAEVAGVHRDAVLVLVGDHPGSYSDALRRAMSRYDLGDRVRLMAITPDIYPWYAISDLLVSASDVESVPRSMLEAMAFGVPVLTTDVFGVPELIEDGANGWLCRARDMVALIAGFHRVLSLTSEQRAKAGEAARSTVRKHHRSSLYGDAYTDLMEELAPLRSEPSARTRSASPIVTGPAGPSE